MSGSERPPVALVTGANAGIGLETARGLAAAGYRVLVTSRDEAKGRQAVEAIRRTTGRREIDLVRLDLASLASVSEAVNAVRSTVDRIDRLVANAGLVQSVRRTTEDGFEMTLGVNHLGHAALVGALLDLVPDTTGRVLVVASDAHRRSPGLDFDDLMWARRRYRGFAVYSDSKLANVLWARGLARRVEGRGIAVHTVHPGAVRTRFGADGDARGWLALVLRLVGPFFLTPRQGAATSLFAALAPDLEGRTGLYLVRSRPVAPSAAGRDDAAGERLWQATEHLLAR